MIIVFNKQKSTNISQYFTYYLNIILIIGESESESEDENIKTKKMDLNYDDDPFFKYYELNPFDEIPSQKYFYFK